MLRSERSFLFAACLAIVIPGTSQAGSISGLAGVNGYPYGVSRYGSAVAGFRPTDSGSNEAFRWTSLGGLVGLGDLGGVDSQGRAHSEAYGISGDGSVVVGWSFSSSKIEAFRWTSAKGMVPLGHPSDGILSSRANGASKDGSVVVGYSVTASAYEAFRWTAQGGMVGLGDLGGGHEFRSYAAAVSADGSVVVGHAASPTGTAAFRWTSANGMVGLAPPLDGSSASYAEGISADGSTIFGFYLSTSGGGRKGFRWTEATGMVGFGEFEYPKAFGEPLAASGDGRMIVGSGRLDWSTQEAVIWTETGGLQELDEYLADSGVDLMGWQLTLASGISPDGHTFVGYGVNPDGFPEAWIVTVPEPSGALPIGVGLLALAGSRRRSVAPRTSRRTHGVLRCGLGVGAGDRQSFESSER